MVKARDTWTWSDFFSCLGYFGTFLLVFFPVRKIVIEISKKQNRVYTSFL